MSDNKIFNYERETKAKQSTQSNLSILEAQDHKLAAKIDNLEKKLAGLKKLHLKLSRELSLGNNLHGKGEVSTGSLNKLLQIKHEKEMKQHIEQLKEYNELKDLSMGIIQLIADQKQATLRTVMNEMGIEDDDK